MSEFQYEALFLVRALLGDQLISAGSCVLYLAACGQLSSTIKYNTNANATTNNHWHIEEVIS